MKSKIEWRMRPIGELLVRVVRPVSTVDDTAYREIGIRSHCKGIFHKKPTTGRRIGKKRVFWVEPGCFVFNIIFAWEQAIALTRDAEAGMIASHRFPMYRSRNGELLPEYVWRYFSSLRGKYDLNVVSPGGAGRNKTLGQEEFNKLRIPVPPIEYQQMAVRILDAADRAVGRTLKLIKVKRSLRTALAEQLLTGASRLPGATGAWQEYRLGDCVGILFSNVDKKSVLHEEKVRLCNYTDVYYNDEITNAIAFMEASAEREEIAKYSLKKWDVVITKDSESPDDIAKPAVVMEDLPGVVCGYHLAILRPKRVHGPFLAQLLRLTRTRYQLYRIANGVTRFGLGQSSLQGLLLRFPDRAEQVRIAAVIGAADRELALLKKKLVALREMKKGLMQKILTGEVRVPARLLKEAIHA